MYANGFHMHGKWVKPKLTYFSKQCKHMTDLIQKIYDQQIALLNAFDSLSKSQGMLSTNIEKELCFLEDHVSQFMGLQFPYDEELSQSKLLFSKKIISKYITFSKKIGKYQSASVELLDRTAPTLIHCEWVLVELGYLSIQHG